MSEIERDYKATTLLPQTAFPMKANLALREPEQLARWEAEGTYPALLEALRARGGAPFVLHDGPPYANGHLHEGHFLNKILKDIAIKTALLEGRPAEFIPGWDCHGLPIELAVDKELGAKKRELDKLAVRRACRAHAQKYIDIQREEFKRLGVFGRWDRPYATMDFGYEAQILRELAKAVRQGVVYRGKKPVYWCVNDRTALAEAEIEYQDDPGPSDYVTFEAVGVPAGEGRSLGDLLPALAGRRARFAIWTTTPWTLPANLAIAVNADFVYLAYELGGLPTLVARDRLFAFLAEVAPAELATASREVGGARFDTAALAHPERLLGYVDGAALEGLRYRHPFLDRVSQIVVGDHVTLEAGTGLVHTAPGHGQDDYLVGRRYGLPILVPVDASGVLTAEAGPFAGEFIEKANAKIEAWLHAHGALLNPLGERRTHSYPHCWRCKKPVIVRATDQWFIAMEAAAANAAGESGPSGSGLRRRALTAADAVDWIPKWGRERIAGMLTTRPDWCISRQRAWGVPIPALYCSSCGEVSLSPEVLDRLAERFAGEGSDAWFAHSVADLVPDHRCGKCGGDAFTKEQDILDVWFDSGVSQAAVVRERLSWPADLYLEGSDQHRGFFQSSLLCALAAGEVASPFRACLTHGFVVDQQGRKLSKSLGNSLDPQKIIRQYGAEIVRLWAASEDYRDDLRLSEEILQRLADAYRKLRNTLRFGLGVLSDYTPASAVDSGALAPLDRYLRSRLHGFLRKAKAAYAAYDFHQVTRAAVDFVSVELSALHFDVSKDRLYCDAANSRSRRSAQTVIFEVTAALCRLLAPILSFTAEEAFAYLPGSAGSVFGAGLPAVDAGAFDPQLEARFSTLLALREDVQAELEALRRAKVIGSSQAARVRIWGVEALPESPIDLGELFIVSSVAFLAEAPPAEAVTGARSGARLVVSPAEGQRCDRCWNHRPRGEARNGGFLCDRCLEVLAGLAVGGQAAGAPGPGAAPGNS